MYIIVLHNHTYAGFSENLDSLRYARFQERTLQNNQDSENGFPQRGRPHRQKELFKQIRILKMDSQTGDTPQTEQAYVYMDIHIHIYLYRLREIANSSVQLM